MTLPVFEEYEPASNCGCAGCAELRSPGPRSPQPRDGGHLGAHARRAVVLATAAGIVLGGGAAAAADPIPPAPSTLPAPVDPPASTLPAPVDPPASTLPAPVDPPAQADPSATGAGATEAEISGDLEAGATEGDPGVTEQPADLAETQSVKQGTALAPALSLPATTRSAIISRAKLWIAAGVPYSTSRHWADGYRQDCSGYVSMAWGLRHSEWTGSLAQYGVRISKSEIRRGDILLFHNPANPTKGSHVTIFGGWVNSAHTYYKAYEETPPHARARSTPFRYWNHSSRYVAYRYRGLATGSGGSASSTAYPGAKYFGKGAKNAYVTRLGKMLVARGGGRFYAQGPGPSWGEADRLATQAFQRAQGWTGAKADGLPGPVTWRLLVTGTGKNIPAVRTGGSASSVRADTAANGFLSGHLDASVEQLRKQLQKKGYGSGAIGSDKRWNEAVRRNVQAFQRAQGWTGVRADGMPGPETWRRLFA
ncbi:peptidoglycan-binding protein [Streptomyces sp. NBC_00344]|uniref:peptidoglycan-binding protein n=1 Tax=Streptomyces sp. NBC_00344 TaxID=2975720 RepID=UPI002E1CFF47